MIKAIAFDFDGVLLESVDVKTRAFRKLFSQERPDQRARIVDYHLQNGGISRYEKFRTIYRDILQRPLDEATFLRLSSQFADLVLDEVVASPWVPGAYEFLQKNKGKYLFFIVTGTPDLEIKEIVRRLNLQSTFADVFGSPRSKADLIHQALHTHHLTAAETLFVGDAINDWHAARETGLSFIWRRASSSIPMLPDYQGLWLPSLIGLDELLTHPRVSTTLA